MSESIWEKDVFIPERNKLEDNIKIDVCIIGAGLAGILTGYMLQKSGLSTVILEADRIGPQANKGNNCKNHIPAWHDLQQLIPEFRKSRSVAVCQCQRRSDYCL